MVEEEIHKGYNTRTKSAQVVKMTTKMNIALYYVLSYAFCNVLYFVFNHVLLHHVMFCFILYFVFVLCCVLWCYFVFCVLYKVAFCAL